MNVVVVCTGNICRSPLAERLLALRLAEAGFDTSVSSCGTDAMVGYSATDRTLQVAREDYGLDLSDHRARQITQDIVDRSDLLLAMTGDHVGEIVRRFPGAAAKTITMRTAAWRAKVLRSSPLKEAEWVSQLVRGSASGSRSDDVADPYGGPLRVFRAMSSDVGELVGTLVASWPRG